MTTTKYPVIIRPLLAEEGGGYLAEYPDLPGCMGDGETVEDALLDGENAIAAWIATAIADGQEIPEPNQFYSYSGQFRARVPRSLHAELARQAALEGVSLNTMTVTLLSAGLARRRSTQS